MTLEPTPSADVVDSEPPLARSPSPSERRIAPHARPRTGYGRFRPQLPRTDSDIDSTTGRSIWNDDSTTDKYWQLWAGTDIGSASRQFSFTRQFDTSVIQRGRGVRVKSNSFTPEALGDSGLPLGRLAAAPTMVRTLLAARTLAASAPDPLRRLFRTAFMVQVFLVRRFVLAARHQSARRRWSLRDWSAC